jgi:polar amino acid transport system substrate-binding protein
MRWPASSASARSSEFLFSRPYYVYAEQLVVRRGEETIRGLPDLRGKRVGTLSGAVSQAMLETVDGVDVKVYTGVVEPYEDLALGRLDAVFLDLPMAAYVEIYRGTPLLVQLYILYYGLPNAGITLSPLAAAFLGLGMNYAAYEAELYRAGIEAVPRGQTEAALSLGMGRGVAFRHVLLPQALRVALPGMTNDFVALFKDSSLVSVIAMVELTKTYNILAATTARFLELGLVAAFLYFGMSYPLSLAARRLEARLRRGRR